jgi:hypothetical protein
VPDCCWRLHCLSGASGRSAPDTVTKIGRSRIRCCFHRLRPVRCDMGVATSYPPRTSSLRRCGMGVATSYQPTTSFAPLGATCIRAHIYRSSGAKDRWGSLRSLDHPLLVKGPSRRYLCESFTECLDPYAGGLQRCAYPFLPAVLRPSPMSHWVGTRILPYGDFSTDIPDGAAVIT